MSEPHATQPLQVVVVGGGIAALEAVLALHATAGDLVAVTLIAPEQHFVVRSLRVAAPFGRGHLDRLALADVMDEHGGRLVCGAVERIDAGAHTLRLVSGGEIAYDALLLAHGAREVSTLPHALTFGEDPAAFGGLLADLDQGYTRTVAFVLPDQNTWPLPLYELALMTAHEAWAMNMDRVELHLVTPEPDPLAVFGPEASAAVAALLTSAGVTVHCGSHARMSPHGDVQTGTGEDLAVDRVVTLPVLEARRLDGIPAAASGFIPVDDTGLVDGLDDVFAVGDATDRPVKQGGLACQQADVAAAVIAVRAGAQIEVPPLEQVLRGRLLTGGHDRFLRRAPAEAPQAASQTPLWWPPTKVSGVHLSPYLAAKGIVPIPAHAVPAPGGIDVEVELDCRRLVPGGVLAGASLPSSAQPHTGLRA
jgi:sulfide:quinone oxidoreductase